MQDEKPLVARTTPAMSNIIYFKASLLYTHHYLQFTANDNSYGTPLRLLLSASMASIPNSVCLIAGRSLSIEKVTVMNDPHMHTRTIERINADRAKLQIEGVVNIPR